ncbi:MAG TPA: hypothetical protein VHQ47_04960 [Phycisphaerae bacterium]|nr:hypothetical protein [Phycisphaerae bacterium]
MKSHTSLWMAVLTLTAIVLGVVLITAPSKTADAQMLNDKQGYTMMMTSNNPGGDEFLVIVDKATQKMLVYRMQGTNLELTTGANFGPWFATAPAPARGRGR